MGGPHFGRVLLVVLWLIPDRGFAGLIFPAPRDQIASFGLVELSTLFPSEQNLTLRADAPETQVLTQRWRSVCH